MNKNKKALIVIDVQNYFVNERTKGIPKKIAHFIRNNKFDFVLFTKFVNNKNSSFFKLLNWRKCLNPPDTNIHPVLSRFIKKDTLFEKASYSAFKSKKFIQFLNRKRIKELFLCGIDIDACVLATAFDAFDLGYKIHVLKDLSKSHSGRKFDRSALNIIEKCLEK
jgi:nicotinamidase-related amidase